MTIEFIPIEKLLQFKETNTDFKLVEVLKAEYYNQGHIPGAISIPYSMIDEKAPQLLAKDEKIIVYCASYQCKISTRAAEKLVKLGFNHVMDYKAGKRGWKQAGFELESTD